MGNPSWDDDGVGGSPSSMDVLLQWLKAPGNAARWRNSAGTRGGSRVHMAYEIFDLLLVNGIKYRTVGSINARLWTIENQLQSAENWLCNNGLRRYDVSKETQQEVLRLCPYYPEIKPLLHPEWSAATATPVNAPAASERWRGRRSYTKRAVETSVDGESHSSDEDEEGEEVLFRAGAKRRGSLDFDVHDEPAKRVRAERRQQEFKLENSKCIALLQAEPDERREFFKLELQVKRDEAILARARARKELLDLGVSTADVDRLMPL